MCIICDITGVKPTFRLHPVSKLRDEIMEFKEKYQEYLSSLNITAQIDEAALLFGERGNKGNFVCNAVTEEGVTLFNASIDTVHTKPFKTTYNPEYLFLSDGGHLDGMRLECMTIERGNSPLHNALLQNHAQELQFAPMFVHLSFKCPTPDDYVDAIYALDNDDGASLVQSCESEYGVFAYYAVPLLGEVYLKPRLNRRDDAPTGPVKPGEVHEFVNGS